jgi:hypothetical protein
MVNDLDSIKEVVRGVMSTDEKTRNSDSWLIIQTLRRLGFKIYVDYHELKDMPSFESITRSRRYWQNTKGILIPTEDINAQRNRRELEFKEAFR